MNFIILKCDSFTNTATLQKRIFYLHSFVTLSGLNWNTFYASTILCASTSKLKQQLTKVRYLKYAFIYGIRVNMWTNCRGSLEWIKCITDRMCRSSDEWMTDKVRTMFLVLSLMFSFAWIHVSCMGWKKACYLPFMLGSNLYVFVFMPKERNNITILTLRKN